MKSSLALRFSACPIVSELLHRAGPSSLEVLSFIERIYFIFQLAYSQPYLRKSLVRSSHLCGVIFISLQLKLLLFFCKPGFSICYSLLLCCQFIHSPFHLFEAGIDSIYFLQYHRFLILEISCFTCLYLKASFLS